MSTNGDNKVHVVFVGRKPGIYFTYDEAFAQVSNFSGSLHTCYASYDEAEEAYIKYCFFHGIDPGFIGAHLQSDVKLSDPGKHAAAVPTRLAVETSRSVFISQECMQNLLKKICFILKVGQPLFNLHHVMTVDGVQYSKYCASVNVGTLGDPIVSVGRYGKDDYAAREDAAVLLAQDLCQRTGKKIRDLNFYNVERLKARLEDLEDENVKLRLQLAMLKGTK